MNLDLYQNEMTETVIAPMISYLEEWEGCSYTSDNVENCRVLLENYLSSLSHMTNPSDEEIMNHVKTLVLALNVLNAQTDYSLIESDAREAIAEIIQGSAVRCGLHCPADDVTGQWREW